MAQNYIDEEEIVGFENEAETIIEYLIRGTNDLDVVPIVGMGGQGKTTIAGKVYNNKSIVARFDVRAWCIISQTYNRRELLQQIFSQVTSSKDKGDQDDEVLVDVLADKLRKSLIRKRYLIVLDDTWDGMAWDDLRLSFPDVGNRSRIIVTTRLEEVAKQVKCDIDPYSLPFLTPVVSLKLLQKKVFQQESCPPELEVVSLEIAEKCKGLPLVIILVAGIIKKNKTEASWWHKINKSLLSSLGESEGYALSTVQLSYDNLPDYLKPCLLYMGMFSEDAIIPVSKLFSLWIAECFVQNIESAEDYLMGLISSNVVMVSKRGYNGKVKYCQVHDIVLYFCLERGREEKCMLAVKDDFQPSEWKENRVSFSFNNRKLFQQFSKMTSKFGSKGFETQCSEMTSKFASLGFETQCSKITSKIASLGFKTQKHFHQHVRSLITTNTNASGFSNWNFFRKVSEMRLLEVLDLSSHRVSSLSSASFQPLVHLKYLAVYTKEFHFHPQLHLLPLETLIVEHPKYSKSTSLPAIFWKMEKLRHVHFIGAEFFLEQKMCAESSKLENLRILRGVGFRIIFHHDIPFLEDALLRRCPNLRQLDISFNIMSCSANRDSLETYSLKLESLTQLQSLRLCRYPLGLHLPSNLKTLVLYGTLKEKAMSLIAGLSSLEHLKLGFIFSQPKELCFGDITFRKLKILKLVDPLISRLNASEESFPLLETLVIRWCDALEEIPLSFADIPTLKQIKLHGCDNDSLKISATKFKKEVEENEGCDRIDLIITKF